jgi:putative hydrolase of the HAD superfamily
MSRPRRALLFDLDDTLYLERRFARSGYRAVAAHVARRFGASEFEVFGALMGELRAERRPQAFQRLCERLDLDASVVNELRGVYRGHEPRLRLPQPSRNALSSSRATWRVGILTNGLPEVQRRKVAALGLPALVDAVIYAHEVGTGKPDPQVFLTACETLGTDPASTVMAGDDPWNDIDGARRAGLRAIRIRRGLHARVDAGETGPADATVGSIGDVPAEAARLIHGGAGRAD